MQEQLQYYYNAIGEVPDGLIPPDLWQENQAAWRAWQRLKHFRSDFSPAIPLTEIEAYCRIHHLIPDEISQKVFLIECEWARMEAEERKGKNA